MPLISRTMLNERFIAGIVWISCLIFWLSASATVTVAKDEHVDGDRIDFKSQIAPILQDHCMRCHSPGINKGDVSLATFEDLGDFEFVVAGDADASHLVDLISSNDDEPPEMPKDAVPLTDEQVSLMRQWINEGADWPDEVVVREKSKADATWWSLQPISKTMNHGTIDAFICEKLSVEGLTMNPTADRRTLIRRATYDLIGLPPTPEEVDTFVNDPDPEAYEKLIDRLLASPHYGERWGRHWLDVVRFGESNGYERNVLINNLWPFRDYVIRSFNDDKPIDQLIREHIAGDVIGHGDPESAIGTAFLVAGPYDDVNNQDAAQKAQIRANTIDEMIRATSEAFFGLTIGCSRCHDHKFDPITQEDYYGLYATFSGIRHGAAPLVSPTDATKHREAVKPLNARLAKLTKHLRALDSTILNRARERIADYEKRWVRPPVDRTGTTDEFDPVTAKFVRLICDASDINPASRNFRIDEFEIWTDESQPRNVALASAGGQASGPARVIEDFPDAYGAQLAIDGKLGARFISTGPELKIELAQPTRINRVTFSSARDETNPDHQKFSFVAEYRVQVSSDAVTWTTVATGEDRKPVNSFSDRKHTTKIANKHQDHRLLLLETTTAEAKERSRLSALVKQTDARDRQSSNGTYGLDWQACRRRCCGPFHVFVGGSPQRPGDEVVPASLQVLDKNPSTYRLDAASPESERRIELARWTTCPDNPLTPRVLANRLWAYHFGNGIVDTPSDFGYMGGRPTHPELLDFLAAKLMNNGWRLKEMHRIIMKSKTYRQSSDYQDDAAAIDVDARFLWRFPPSTFGRRSTRHDLASFRTTESDDGRPRDSGSITSCRTTFVRMCRWMSTGRKLIERAVYHQNARASVVDLMTEFDQPDCTFSAPKRAETTTPLQALTMLNHQFSLDMANSLAKRLQTEAGDDRNSQIRRDISSALQGCPIAKNQRLVVSLVETTGLPHCAECC